MAEDVNTPAAESSPAPEAAPVEVPREPQAYAEWRKTGKTPAPAAKPKVEASAASENSSAEGDEPEGKSAPAPEAGHQQQDKPKPRSNAETRLNELLADLRQAGLTPAELKTFRKQLQNQNQPPAAPEKTEKPAGSEAPKKPKLEDYKTYQEYEDARDTYYEELADYKAGKKLDDFRMQAAQQHAQQELAGKVAEATKRYGADATGTIAEAARGIWHDQAIPEGVKQFFSGSPALVDTLYVLGSKPEEFAQFLDAARSDPAAAIRQFVMVEHLVMEELTGRKPAKPESADDTPRDPSGKFTKASPAPPVTKAPPPPREASGRSAAPPDEVESAAKDGDFARYRLAANRRDLARRKGQ